MAPSSTAMLPAGSGAYTHPVWGEGWKDISKPLLLGWEGWARNWTLLSISLSFKWTLVLPHVQGGLQSSVLCVFKTASSQPPNFMASKFLNGWKPVYRVLGHVCGELALVFALTASKPEHRWDWGILGKYGQLHSWERELACWGSVEATDTIFASRNGQWLWFTAQTSHPGWEPARILRLQQTWRCQQGTAPRMSWIPARPG